VKPVTLKTIDLHERFDRLLRQLVEVDGLIAEDIGIDRTSSNKPLHETREAFERAYGYALVLYRRQKKTKKDCPYDSHADDCDCRGAGGDR